YYTGFLGSAGSTGEINSWVTLMLQGASDEQVAAQFLSAAEYFPTSGPGSSNAGWVAKVYNDLLKRSSTGDQQAANFVSQLNAGTTTRTAVAFALLTSAEYRRILVATFFNKYLGRNKPIPPSASDPDLRPS